MSALLNNSLLEIAILIRLVSSYLMVPSPISKNKDLNPVAKVKTKAKITS